MATVQSVPLVFPLPWTGPPNLTDLFHRVNALLPDDQAVVTVRPDTSVSQAVRVMEEGGFSQLPVVEGDEVLGVFSYRSLAMGITAAKDLRGMSLEQIPVGEFIEQLRFVHIRDDPMSAVDSLDRDGAVLVGFDFTVKGKAALREHFEGYLKRLGSLRLISTDRFTETEDSIFFEATIESDLGEARVYDVFILRDGKATHQFTGVISVSPRSFPT